jgi:hypothetical protein
MKRAILIASSDFPDDPGIEPLRFPVNDVNAVESTLRRDDFGFEVQKFIRTYLKIAGRSRSAINVG